MEVLHRPLGVAPRQPEASLRVALALLDVPVRELRYVPNQAKGEKGERWLYTYMYIYRIHTYIYIYMLPPPPIDPWIFGC